jgi:hypothetical protein
MGLTALTSTRRSTHAGFLATVLRRLDAADAHTLDPWLPFPQNGCSFAFGQPPRPLPIGALRLLWAQGHPFTQACPVCSQPVRVVFMGGLLTIGGGRLICAACEGDFFQSVGPLTSVATLLDSSSLRGTEFAPSLMVFGGAVGSDGAQLLAGLGLTPVQQQEWGVVAADDGTRLQPVIVSLPAPRNAMNPL